MHKFRYYPENFGRTLCVGCGRCIEHCPVSIDLRDVLEAVKEPVLLQERRDGVSDSKE